MVWFPPCGVSILAYATILLPCIADEGDARSAAPAVVVVDKSLGCFHYEVKRTEFVLEGDYYVGSDHRLPKSYIDGLRSLVLSSREDSSNLLAQVGITPEAVEEHRHVIYDTVRKWCPEMPEEIPTWAEKYLSYDRVRWIAFDALAGRPPVSTTTVEFRVEIRGDPPVTVRSTADRAWMLPWSVMAGDDTWQTYSLIVSKALGVLSDPTGPNAPLLDGTYYWTWDFWQDEMRWSLAIGTLNAIFSQQLCESLEGYEAAQQLFTIESAEIGDINLAPRSLFAQVSAVKPMLVDAARWWNPLVDRRPTRDWNDFMAIHEACTDAARSHLWLDAWKRAAPTRTISLEVVGTCGFSESNMELEVIPTWKGVGLAGLPEFELLLYESGRSRGTVFLGSQEERALVMDVRQGTGDHWLDQMVVEAPLCLIVDRLDRWENHNIIRQPKP